ncbi:formyltransferase family protein (plasmid) [Sinorhizobium numidicum]|uniref:Formyltransferase family protein n=1 Tax=Sinorhizobium numidicum TaxID=680248 RepID=A0ABY8D576_9HYPH|nr:formyltransferase family protein [Sinorhizobium numidicum]WEX79327.1 formyltransferase family protein [Sinorhizobium numidicum]WEX85302.1 formyltransferase family protein [Sinorhizobium numidicum]
MSDKHDIPYLDECEAAGADYNFIVSVMWNHVFPQNVLQRASNGGINFHPAPLPQYRGSFARTHAIINREEVFGVTIHHLFERVDTGDIIAELEFPIQPDETAISLDLRAQEYGFPLFCLTWLRLLDGSSTAVDQSSLIASGQRRARFYPLSAMDDLIASEDAPRSEDELQRLFRALFLPPRITPPDWLCRRLAGSDLLQRLNWPPSAQGNK